MNRSASKNVLNKITWLAGLAILALAPGQVLAQYQCEASLSGGALGGPLFFAGEPITISIDLGAGDVLGFEDNQIDPLPPEQNYLDISEFSYMLDCQDSGSLDCLWAGNDVSLMPGSIVTDCTTDGAAPNGGNLVNFNATIQNPAPPGVDGPGVDPSPSILFTPTNGTIRNFSGTDDTPETCNVQFSIMVNAIEGDNPEKIIRQFTGWTDAEGVCPNVIPPPPPDEPAVPLRASAALPITFDLSTEIVRFLVTKDFTDDSSEPVDVHVSCNGGLPLEQSATIVDPDGSGTGFTQVTFSVRYITAGETDCTVTEDPVPSLYTPTYTASAAANGVAGSVSPPNEVACEYTDIQTGDFVCAITNTADPVEITVNKIWEGTLDRYDGELVATANYSCYDVLTEKTGPDGTPTDVQGSLTFTGATDTQVIDGIWAAPGDISYCEVTETIVDSIVEADDSDCSNVPVEPGAECTITNFVFFEGIPTLNQYGMALLALLMLGVGFVGMRRFA